MGIFYLLFCWTLIPLIASLIKGIMYLTMTDADFAVTYG
jgi:TM2 domain-containing membrane protein YozV